MAPILLQPNMTSKNSGEFLLSTATRSPDATPLAINALATRELRPSRSANDKVVDSNDRAGDSARVSAC